MKRRWLWPVLIVAASAMALTFALGGGTASSASNCVVVNGHLLDAHVTGDPSQGTVGRMIGGINGEYHFFSSATAFFDGPVLFGAGNTTIETEDGNLYWHEDSALDLTNEDEYSTTVLARVTGGTGEWAGAHGHVIMSGYFHVSTLSGQFDYRGSICRN